ncbi:hypothetical protein [Azotosporobacter soli]|uniref:hypothetical protein n=1 Tax=Azotosporobacter soli TaxID=3055040 RepID=UPI0031FE712B
MTKRLMVLLLLLMFGCPTVQGQSIERVENIQVAVTSANPLATALQARLENSLATVTRQMLSGKNVEEIRQRQGQYERVLQEVFTRVLFGYEVERVELVPGRQMQVRMQVTPWGDLVEQVDVQFDYGNLPQELQPLLEKDLAGLTEGMRNLFVGLPVDSEDWAIGVAKTELRDRAALQLPEYTLGVELASGTHSVVKITLVPNGQLVQDSRISIRSPNLPNLLLLDLKPVLAQEITSWRNLPVGWVARHRDYFVQRLLKKAEQAPLTKRYNLQYQIELQPGSLVDVYLTAKTDGYKINAEGYLDMGRKENNTSARLHAGRMMNKQEELFGEVDFYPTTFTWKFSGGVSHHFGRETDIGFQYLLSDRQGKWWLRQNLSDSWQLRLERYPKNSDYEMGLRYRLHEFLSVEYVFTKQENWLRLIGVL